MKKMKSMGDVSDRSYAVEKASSPSSVSASSSVSKRTKTDATNSILVSEGKKGDPTPSAGNEPFLSLKSATRRPSPSFGGLWTTSFRTSSQTHVARGGRDRNHGKIATSKSWSRLTTHFSSRTNPRSLEAAWISRTTIAFAFLSCLHRRVG